MVYKKWKDILHGGAYARSLFLFSCPAYLLTIIISWGECPIPSDQGAILAAEHPEDTEDSFIYLFLPSLHLSLFLFSIISFLKREKVSSVSSAYTKLRVYSFSVFKQKCFCPRSPITLLIS
jgi:ABC-type dipeptide/oligopeptide/nickel transport system permease component